MKLLGVCVDWLRSRPGWDRWSSEGLTASSVARHLLLPTLRRRWPGMPCTEASLDPAVELATLTQLDEAAAGVHARLEMVSAVVHEVCGGGWGCGDQLVHEVATKLLRSAEAFESFGESLCRVELSAVASTYLKNRRREDHRLPWKTWPARGWRGVVAPQGGEVVIASSGTGQVVFAEEPASSSGEVVIEVIGGRVAVDVARPERLPSCHVTDPIAGARAIRSLYGESVAQAVCRNASTLGWIARCSVSPGPALAGLVNLACLRWSRHRSPFPLDDTLLRAQELCLVGRLSGLLADESAWAVGLSDVCGELLDSIGEGDEAVDRVLIDAMELLGVSNLGS